jgi:hypothetical protein
MGIFFSKKINSKGAELLKKMWVAHLEAARNNLNFSKKIRYRHVPFHCKGEKNPVVIDPCIEKNAFTFIKSLNFFRGNGIYKLHCRGFSSIYILYHYEVGRFFTSKCVILTDEENLERELKSEIRRYSKSIKDKMEVLKKMNPKLIKKPAM